MWFLLSILLPGFWRILITMSYPSVGTVCLLFVLKQPGFDGLIFSNVPFSLLQHSVATARARCLARRLALALLRALLPVSP